MPGRKEHVNGQKHCPTCDTYKNLDEYNVQSSSWDKLARMCRDCSNTFKKNTRNKQKDQEYLQKYVESGRRREVSQKRYQERREEILKRCAAYNTKRYREDPVYRMTVLNRTRAKREMEKIKNNTCPPLSRSTLHGCTYDELKKHIEGQFEEGMTWENHGIHGWHLDHVIPVSSFDMTNEEDVRMCFHYSNLQPLWAADNLEKSNKVFPL